MFVNVKRNVQVPQKCKQNDLSSLVSACGILRGETWHVGVSCGGYKGAISVTYIERSLGPSDVTDLGNVSGVPELTKGQHTTYQRPSRECSRPWTFLSSRSHLPTAELSSAPLLHFSGVNYVSVSIRSLRTHVTNRARIIMSDVCNKFVVTKKYSHVQL